MVRQSIKASGTFYANKKPPDRIRGLSYKIELYGLLQGVTERFVSGKLREFKIR